MKRKERIALRDELDRRIKFWKLHYKVPAKGWIHEVRAALGMTTRQMARFLKCSQPAVTKLEQAEIKGTISLGNLKKAAKAMGCEFYYLIAPAKGKTLADVMHERAKFVATLPTMLSIRRGGFNPKTITYGLLQEMIKRNARYVTPRELWRDSESQTREYVQAVTAPPPPPPSPQRTPEEEKQDELINELFRQQIEKIREWQKQGKDMEDFAK